MSKFQIAFVAQPEQVLYGLHQQSNNQSQRKDIPSLSAQFYDRIGATPKAVLPLYIVSRDYDDAAGTFTLFIGDDGSNHGLERETLPSGTYAKLEVRPKLGLLWGLAVGAAKRWFYTQWLPRSPYEAVNLEYELHTEKSVGKRPAVDLLFAIRSKSAHEANESNALDEKTKF